MRVYGYLLALLAVAAPLHTYDPVGAVRAADSDAARLTPGDAPYQRYLVLPHKDEDLPRARLVQKLHWNKLSRHKSMGTPTQVSPRLLRIDLRDYKLPATVWEQFAAHDVYFHSKKTYVVESVIQQYWPGGVDPKDKKHYARGAVKVTVGKGGSVDAPAYYLPQEMMDRLRACLITEVPIVNAQWALVQSARDISIRNQREGAGYRDFLQFQNRDEYFDLVGIDKKETNKRLLELRAFVPVSGISQQGRFAESANGVGGWGMFTLDTFREQGRGVGKRNLRRAEFVPDAERHIFPLPNGLPGNALFDGKGLSQDSAPDQLGPDDSPHRVGKDGRVHNGISCERCHGARNKAWEYVIPLKDWARKHFTKGRALTDPDKKVELELRAQFLEDIERPLKLARENFRHAYGKATGLSVYEACTLYCQEWNDYVERPVTLEVASRELGTTPEKFLLALKAYQKVKGQIDNVLAGFLDDSPEPLTRLEWEDTYQFAMSILLGIVPPDIARKQKVK